jgi:dihydrofolate reductase
VKASVFIATSLDGYIARLDGGLDWLPENGGEPHGYDEFIASVDAIVIGRMTYEIVLGFEAWPYGEKAVIVLSNSLTEIKAPPMARCSLMRGDPAALVVALEKKGFKHLYIDGGVTIQGFLNAGLIQTLTITRIPVVLGSGIPLFGPADHDIRMTHVATRTYPSGMVQTEYRVVGVS